LIGFVRGQIQERQREANWLPKALEDTGIELDCVATEILGKFGRAMLDALVGGATDPQGAGRAGQGKAARQLREVLEGRFEPHYALVIGVILEHVDFLDEHPVMLYGLQLGAIVAAERVLGLLWPSRQQGERIYVELAVTTAS